MNLLALDTATEACSVALQFGEELIELNEMAGRRQTERILPMIDSLLAEAGIKPGALDAIIFGRGPGAFTGLRVSAGVVQGLAYALQIPVVGVSSLNILAQTVFRMHGCTQVVSLFDARMSEVYWCRYQIKDGLMSPRMEESVSPPTTVGFDANSDLCVAGPGWSAYREVFANAGLNGYTDIYPGARDAISLGKKMLHIGAFLEPQAAIPVYVRDDVAWKKSR